MQKEIFEYIRRRKSGKTYKVGVVLGTIDGGVVRIGWSKCNLKAGDKFSPEQGIAIAQERAKNQTENTQTHIPLPKCLRTQVRNFGARAIRYFKEATRVEFPNYA